MSDMLVVTLMATCFFLPFEAAFIAYILSNEEGYQVTIGMKITYVVVQTICTIAMVPVGLLAGKNLGEAGLVYFWFFAIILVPIALAIGGKDEQKENQKKREQEDRDIEERLSARRGS